MCRWSMRGSGSRPRHRETRSCVGCADPCAALTPVLADPCAGILRVRLLCRAQISETMSTSTRIGGGGPVKLWWRAARCLGCDGNPLRRGVDRAESLAMTVLVFVLVVAGPVLAISVGRTADAAAVRQQHAEVGNYQ